MVEQILAVQRLRDRNRQLVEERKRLRAEKQGLETEARRNEAKASRLPRSWSPKKTGLLRTHTELGMRQSEAAGVSFEDPDKRRAVIACAADFNSDAEAHRQKKTSRSGLPSRAGF